MGEPCEDGCNFDAVCQGDGTIKCDECAETIRCGGCPGCEGFDEYHDATELLNTWWRGFRDGVLPHDVGRFLGAVAMLKHIGVFTSDHAELWERRIKTCPGHDDEGGRVWCAYCGEMKPKPGEVLNESEGAEHD